MLQPIVGEVAELLDIKHNPYKAYMAARDKYLTRQVCYSTKLAVGGKPELAKEKTEKVIAKSGIVVANQER